MMLGKLFKVCCWAKCNVPNGSVWWGQRFDVIRANGLLCDVGLGCGFCPTYANSVVVWGKIIELPGYGFYLTRPTKSQI